MKVKSPQINARCERFNKTISQAFYQITFWKKLYESIDVLQKDLDELREHDNNERTHQGKICCIRIPLKTLLGGKRIWAEKKLTQI